MRFLTALSIEREELMPQTTFITIRQGMEYQSHEESIYLEDSFFAPAYRQAAVCLQEIIYANRCFRERQNRNWSGCQGSAKNNVISDAGINRQLLGYPNNILAFCAERGQGKTSAMVSFAKALHEMHIPNINQESKSRFWGGSCIPGCQFVVVDSIDPTVMEDQDSIMDTILSRMFNQFQTEWERRVDALSFDCRQTECSQSKRVELLKLFQKCSRNLQIISGVSSRQDTDILEQMMEQGDSFNMRGAMYRLICKFLDFMCQDSENAYLVIQIDDADFNIPRAYNIIDDIRRYLVLPKVLILLAANMSQLEVTVEQHFIEQYRCSIQNNGMATVAHCHEIAERYVSKVIPGNHRIYLPDIQSLIGNEYEHLQIKYLNDKGDNIFEKEIQGTNAVCYYQDQLLRFLYQRTGLILLNPGSFLHNLIPGNLRELTQFLTFFNQMDKLEIDYFTLADYFSGYRAFKTEKEKMDLWRNNLTKMERYLIEIWAPINLRTEGHTMLRRLSNEPDDNKNRYLLQILPDYYGRERVKFNETNGASALTEKEYRDIFIKACRSHGLSHYTPNSKLKPSKEREHASYADVCEALNVLSSLPGNNQQYKLIYAIHFLYTIRLHQLLLNQVELSTVPGGDQRENTLVQFLADVLYKRADKKDDPSGFPLWQHSLSTQYFRELYGIDKIKSNSEGFGLISAFCRYTEPVSHSYASRLIRRDSWDKGEENGTLYFNFFYSNLWDLDMLTSAEPEHHLFRPDSDSGCQMRNKMAGSFTLLMNWDVQYVLLRNLRYHELTSADILENMRGVYSGKYMQALLEQICQLTDEEQYANVFDKYSEYIRQKEFGYVIQWAVPYFKEPMMAQLRKLIEEIEGIFEIHQDTSSQTKISDILEKDEIGIILYTIRDMTAPLYRAQNEPAPLEEKDIYDLTFAEISGVLEQYKELLKKEEEKNKINRSAILSQKQKINSVFPCETS